MYYPVTLNIKDSLLLPKEECRKARLAVNIVLKIFVLLPEVIEQEEIKASCWSYSIILSDMRLCRDSTSLTVICEYMESMAGNSLQCFVVLWETLCYAFFILNSVII